MIQNLCYELILIHIRNNTPFQPIRPQGAVRYPPGPPHPLDPCITFGRCWGKKMVATIVNTLIPLSVIQTEEKIGVAHVIGNDN